MHLKGSYNATCTLTISLNWNVCWQCVYCTQPPYNDKNTPSVFFVILLNVFPFLKSSLCPCDVTRTEAPPIIVWLTAFEHRLHWCLTSDPPWVNCHQLFHRPSRCSQDWLLSDWGVLLLDVIMNTVVVIYSRHLSRWRVLPLVLKGKRPRST